MTKQDLLDGKKFTYHGSFRRIAHKGFKFDKAKDKDMEVFKQWHYHANTECIVSGEIDEAWYVKSISDDKFVVWKNVFGAIPMLFKECQLVKEGDA